MNYVIRLANISDLKALCKIRNNEKLFLNYLQLQHSEQAYLTVAQVEQELVGFGVLKVHGPLVPKLSDLFVYPDYRHQGIGKALIAFREVLATQLGYAEIFVSVDPIENPKMVQLVKTIDYHAIGEPYEKNAIYYSGDGTAHPKSYVRVDFKKQLLDI